MERLPTHDQGGPPRPHVLGKGAEKGPIVLAGTSLTRPQCGRPRGVRSDRVGWARSAQTLYAVGLGPACETLGRAATMPWDGRRDGLMVLESGEACHDKDGRWLIRLSPDAGAYGGSYGKA